MLISLIAIISLASIEQFVIKPKIKQKYQLKACAATAIEILGALGADFDNNSIEHGCKGTLKRLNER